MSDEVLDQKLRSESVSTAEAVDDVAAADMVTRGDIIDRFHDNVAYSLRMLSDPSLPTDTDSAIPLS
ncbi:hypothetical protein ACFWCB_11410 [Streptomyces sp. NPDC060048]|uniref:hypothetical protein n=1 Tax=unclassified Streptomyces TaxID=2593676 RepID=UPI003678C45B